MKWSQKKKSRNENFYLSKQKIINLYNLYKGSAKIADFFKFFIMSAKSEVTNPPEREVN